jgi:hypothetical protein
MGKGRFSGSARVPMLSPCSSITTVGW